MLTKTHTDELHGDVTKVTLTILKCRTCHEMEAADPAKPDFPSTWAPPCGWAGMPNPGADLMIVALNPGRPIEGSNSWTDVGFSEDPATITEAHAREINRRSFDQYMYPGRGRDYVFHKKSVALARSLLWLLDGKDPGCKLWRRCWFTDTFKCSTRQEVAPRITRRAFANCRPHLEAEYAILQPKLVVALGAGAYDAIGKRHGWNVVKFRHPSRRCPKLHSAVHDPSFREAARLLGVSFGEPLEARFREVRRDLQSEYFGGRNAGRHRGPGPTDVVDGVDAGKGQERKPCGHMVTDDCGW